MALGTGRLRWGGGGRYTGRGGGLSSLPPHAPHFHRETKAWSRIWWGSSPSLFAPPAGNKEERQEQVTPKRREGNLDRGDCCCHWGELVYGQQVTLPPVLPEGYHHPARPFCPGALDPASPTSLPTHPVLCSSCSEQGFPLQGAGLGLSHFPGGTLGKAARDPR